MSIAQLSTLPDEIKKDIVKVMGQVAQGVPNVVRPRSPIRTGHLRRSWKSRHFSYQADIMNTAAYAEYVENGTSRMAARPNIYPLIPSITAEIERAILTGTDFYMKGSAFSDSTSQLKAGFRQTYGSYGSHVGYSV